MNLKEIEQFRQKTTSLIREGRLLEALETITSAAENAMQWEIGDRLKTMRSHYGYMLNYFVKGLADPGRDEMRRDMTENLSVALDEITRKLLSAETPTLYYNTLRTIEATAGRGSLTRLMKAYRDQTASGGDFFGKAMTGGAVTDMSGDRRLEGLEKDLFLRVWTLFPLTEADASLLGEVLVDETVDDSLRLLLISAVWLGGMEFFDARRVDILCDLYAGAGDNLTRARAVMSLILLLWRHRDRSLGRNLEARIAMLGDTTEWNLDVMEAFIELIRTSGTQAIVESVQKDLMSRISPEMLKSMSSFQAPDMAGADAEEALFNPEWEKVLENSDIREKMKQLGEIQEEGGDVFMAAFARLKQFPFFNDISNWFLPFRVSHSAFDHPGVDMEQMSEAVAGMPYLCDSDKYSTMLSATMIPSAQLGTLISQLKAANDYLTSQGEGNDSDTRHMKGVLNSYAKTLYRFYNLFRRKGEFANPFGGSISLTEVPVLAPVFSDPSTAAGIAEFYLKIKCWGDALAVFKFVDSRLEPESARYQKMGLCCEKTGDIRGAIDYYERADLLEADSEWTLRRLAGSLLASGQHHRAITFLKKLVNLYPEEEGLLVQLAEAYVARGQGEKALPVISKVMYLYPDNEAMPGLRARARMQAGKLEEAAEDFRKIFDRGSASDEYLMYMGHCQWGMGNISAAAEAYRVVVRRKGLAAFVEMMEKDKPFLTRTGIIPQDIPLMIDAVAVELRGPLSQDKN